MVLNEITYYSVLGKPLILYLGVFALALFIITASIPIVNKRRADTIPFKWHHRVAALALALAAIHGALGLLAYI